MHYEQPAEFPFDVPLPLLHETKWKQRDFSIEKFLSEKPMEKYTSVNPDFFGFLYGLFGLDSIYISAFLFRRERAQRLVLTFPFL